MRQGGAALSRLAKLMGLAQFRSAGGHENMMVTCCNSVQSPRTFVLRRHLPLHDLYCDIMSGARQQQQQQQPLFINSRPSVRSSAGNICYG